MSGAWRLLRGGAVPPVEAMAVDEALLAARESRTLRLYGWNPHAVSLGYFQKESEVDWERFARENVPVVRRLTGGGAIFHGDETTFSIAAPADDPLFSGTVHDSYERVHRILVDAMNRCGAAGAAPRRAELLQSEKKDSFWCFHKSTDFDLAARSRKLVGSAQRRTSGWVLHHGSIVLRGNRFTPETASLEELGLRGGARRLEDAIVDAFAAATGERVEPGELSAAERALASGRCAERYNSDSWTRRRIAP